MLFDSRVCEAKRLVVARANFLICKLMNGRSLLLPSFLNMDAISTTTTRAYIIDVITFETHDIRSTNRGRSITPENASAILPKAANASKLIARRRRRRSFFHGGKERKSNEIRGRETYNVALKCIHLHTANLRKYWQSRGRAICQLSNF